MKRIEIKLTAIVLILLCVLTINFGIRVFVNPLSSIKTGTIVSASATSVHLSNQDVSKISKFDLRDKINIPIKNQNDSEQCWIMAMSTVFETNLSLKNRKSEKISLTHMDYGSSISFSGLIDKSNKANRAVTKGGTSQLALAYMTNGTGPVLEEKITNSNIFNNISLTNFEKLKSDYYVNNWVQIPSIYKNRSGNTVTYKDEFGKIYTEEQVQAIRTQIKQQIIENGAIYAPTNAEKFEDVYNISTYAYYANSENVGNIKPDHAIVIIGWDDNFSKENFKGKTKPLKDGAYLVQGSWGNNPLLNKGTYYISYEDMFIEQELTGIVNIGEVDYNKIYQYDNLGANQYLKSSLFNVIYGGNVFKRESMKDEYLTSIGISTYCNMRYSVYVNSSDGTLSSKKLVKVETLDEILSPGYHRIYFDEPIKLTGESFAVVIEYIGIKGEEISIASQSNTSTLYENVTSNSGQGYIGYFLDFMMDISKQYKNTNISIKAFTNNEATNTHTKPTETNTDGSVVGDINGDGKLTALDISKCKLALVSFIELTSSELQRADINGDGKLTSNDLSKLKEVMVK